MSEVYKYRPGTKFLVEVESADDFMTFNAYRMKGLNLQLSEHDLERLERYPHISEYNRGFTDCMKQIGKKATVDIESMEALNSTLSNILKQLDELKSRIGLK